ncbi:MAG: methyltransferase domain-containing protein [Acidobacteria bacterium]|nr:methyltransferase domain-containing protein [Acidobacteriota bacterium]
MTATTEIATHSPPAGAPGAACASSRNQSKQILPARSSISAAATAASSSPPKPAAGTSTAPNSISTVSATPKTPSSPRSATPNNSPPSTAPRQALLDLHPLLAPNGTLLIAVPNAYGSQARLFGTNWLALDVPRHLHHFSSQSLQLLLTQTGFKPSRLRHHEAEYDIFGWMQSVINKVHHKPNVLFDLLTGRKLQLSPLARTTQLLAGALLFTPAFILTVITT